MPSSSGTRFYTPPPGRERRGNPYFASKRKDRLGTSVVKNTLYRLSPRVWLWFFLFIFLIGVIAWLLIWSNVFLVRNIEIRGTSLIPAAALESIAQERLEGRRAWIFPESRLFVFNSQDFKADVAERYPFEELRIIKRLPSTLVISLTEKPAAAVWFEGDSYYYVSNQGEILALSAGASEELPTIYNNGSARIKGAQVTDSAQAISFAEPLRRGFEERFPSTPIRQLVVDNEQRTIKLLPQAGAMVYFSTDDSVENQLNRLELLLSTELKDRFTRLRYIDLRFGDRVYYQ